MDSLLFGLVLVIGINIERVLADQKSCIKDCPMIKVLSTIGTGEQKDPECVSSCKDEFPSKKEMKQ